MPASPETPLLSAQDALAGLEALLQPKKLAIRQRVTLAFAIHGAGGFFLDTGRTPMISEGWRDDAQVSIVCNLRGLSDLLFGALDPTEPKPGQLFVWGGDTGAWRQLAQALGGAKRTLAAQIDAMRR
jgi:hypothetical protein